MQGVRDLGDWRVAWPEGIAVATDLPWTFVDAWTFAQRVLGWYEHLPEDEQPPRAIWQDTRRLKAWFEEVKQKRKSKNDDGAEAPEGTLQEARDGYNVTLRNQLARNVVEAHDLSAQLYDADPLS